MRVPFSRFLLMSFRLCWRPLRWSYRTLERVVNSPFFGGGQLASCAFFKFSQSQRPHGYAHEPEYFHSKTVQNPPDLPVPALMQHDFEPTVLLAAPKESHKLYAQHFSIRRLDAVQHGVEQSLISDAIDVHMIRLIEVAVGRQHSACPLGIVCQQKEALARFVQAAHGSYPR